MLEPGRLVDITLLPMRGITCAEDTLRVGALVTMNELAADPTVSERVPFVRDALLAGASPQLRNMATIGGNLLQPTPTALGLVFSTPCQPIEKGLGSVAEMALLQGFAASVRVWFGNGKDVWSIGGC